MCLTARCLTVLALVLIVTPALNAHDREDVMGDLIRDATTVETQIIALAKTMPPAVYEWRPAKGVATGEVFTHVAGDNYFLPALMGVPAPPETGIDGRDNNKGVAAFEARPMARSRRVSV